MVITCVCCTYKRPKQVGYLLNMFERQTHEDKRLLIFDDGGTFKHAEWGENWRLLKTNRQISGEFYRYPSLGLKRNAACRIALMHFPETEAICPWDDDDYFMPWHLEITNAALEKADWALPSKVLYRNPDGSYRQHFTGPKPMYHSAHGYRLEALIKASGHDDGFLEPYDDTLSGPEDQSLFRRLEKIGATIADPLEPGRGLSFKPSYCYGTNDGLMHISAYLKPNDTGEEAYRVIGEQTCERQDLIIEPPPGIELDKPFIHGSILPRPF
jgi:hypothetical protein